MKIAIVKLSALGDIVHAMVALQFIKKRIPNLQVDWLVEQRFAELLRENPDINQIHAVNIKALKQNKKNVFKEVAKIRQLRKNQYDLVIDAQGLIKSAMTARLISSRTSGFDKNSIREKAASSFYHKTIQSAYDSNTIDRNAKVIGASLNVDITPEDILNKQPFLFYRQSQSELQNYLNPKLKNILFVIGSTWESRNYPKEKYLNVIQGLDANCLILWGNMQEKQTAAWIADKAENTTILPKIDLNQLKYLIAHINLVIGNDTGPTHMAWGLNIPSITLFGPTPVSRVYQTKINAVLKSPSVVNPYKLNKNDFSIKEIKPEDVIKQALALLKTRE